MKRQNSLEAVRELIALLERCNAFNWAGKFHNVKDALELSLIHTPSPRD